MVVFNDLWFLLNLSFDALLLQLVLEISFSFFLIRRKGIRVCVCVLWESLWSSRGSASGCVRAASVIFASILLASTSLVFAGACRTESTAASDTPVLAQASASQAPVLLTKVLGDDGVIETVLARASDTPVIAARKDGGACAALWSMNG